ncbi:MAG: metal ABC transporter ATP-binding protein [Syntrophomonadaceae bacterium]|jgi:zinc transport system ATP-binding protein
MPINISNQKFRKAPCGLCCTKVENFGVTRGNSVILKAINFHVHCGELTAIIGPNGAGKSTLLKAILGEIPHSGELHYLNAAGLHTDHPVIGYVPQRLDFDLGSPISVLDLFAASLTMFPVWIRPSSRVINNTRRNLARVQAEHLLHRRLGALSGGELQRVLLALALDPIPDLLLLDEPVSGIDQRGMELFYHMVSSLRHQYDLSIILVSHDLTLVSKYADQVVLLNQTVQCTGTPQEVFADPRTIQTFGYFRAPAWVNKNIPECREGAT